VPPAVKGGTIRARAGITPITVIARPLSTTDRPTTPGSAPKRARHMPSLSTTAVGSAAVTSPA
jgi:hypothetical protein